MVPLLHTPYGAHGAERDWKALNEEEQNALLA
jgi:hypothetical protein